MEKIASFYHISMLRTKKTNISENLVIKTYKIKKAFLND